MSSIAGGRGWHLFSVDRGMIWWCRRSHQRPLFSSLAGGGGDAPPHLPVVIVGAGPVELVLSFLLTKFGISNARSL